MSTASPEFQVYMRHRNPLIDAKQPLAQIADWGSAGGWADWTDCTDAS